MKKPEIKRHSRLTNRQVIELFNSLSNLKGVTGKKVLFAISRTLESLRPIAMALDHSKLIPKSEAFSEYENEIRIEVAAAKEKLIQENPNSPALIQTDSGVELRADSFIALSILKRLKEKHKTAIEQYSKDVAEFNQFLENECEEEYELFHISLDEAPEEQDKFSALYHLIER